MEPINQDWEDFLEEVEQWKSIKEKGVPKPQLS